MNKALFWDFDGTLSYPNKAFDTALYDAIVKNGFFADGDAAVKFLKNAYSWKTPQLDYPANTCGLWWNSFFEKIRSFCKENGIPDEAHQGICNDVKVLLTDVSNYELYQDTEEVLKKCAETGYKNYLITNNYPEIINNLEKLNIAHLFSDFIVSSHIGYEKPRGEFFDYAKMAADNPETGYVIGDNPVADIQGGKKAGFITVAVHKCTESEADYYLENLSEIFSILA